MPAGRRRGARPDGRQCDRDAALHAEESAVANAEHNHGADIDELKVAVIQVDAAPQLKRFAARAKGRGARIIKRNSHITVGVSDGKKD